ncbi:MAG: hypothetical protein OXI16_09875 [Chloroflexota bacterium]|nr:hypothetical protein [Chloroflexota bacterium]
MTEDELAFMLEGAMRGGRALHEEATMAVMFGVGYAEHLTDENVSDVASRASASAHIANINFGRKLAQYVCVKDWPHGFHSQP